MGKAEGGAGRVSIVREKSFGRETGAFSVSMGGRTVNVAKTNVRDGEQLYGADFRPSARSNSVSSSPWLTEKDAISWARRTLRAYNKP